MTLFAVHAQPQEQSTQKNRALFESVKEATERVGLEKNLFAKNHLTFFGIPFYSVTSFCHPSLSNSDLCCFSSTLPFHDFEAIGVGGETIGDEKRRFAK
jgi:hypothetical protein